MPRKKYWRKGRNQKKGPRITHNVEDWKGHCIPFGPLLREKPLRRNNHPYESEEPSVGRVILDSARVASFLAELGNSSMSQTACSIQTLEYADTPQDPYSYPVVVKNEVDENVIDGIESVDDSSSSLPQLSNALPVPISTLSPKKEDDDVPISTLSPKKEDDDVPISTLSPKKEDDDSTLYFGKTVVSRIKNLDGKKRAKAMQKIMQVLFEIEFNDV